MAAAWPEIGGRFSRGRLETFSNGPEGMEEAGTIPAPHKPRGDPLMDDGDVGADPFCERTYWASNAACSLVAAFELSVTENSQQQRNDSGIVKMAGDT